MTEQPIAPPLRPRRIRSFVLRAGRMTAGQERAWHDLWPRYGIELTDETLDLRSIFTRDAPRMLEIGFGTGEALLAFAEAYPEFDCLGIEVHRPGVGHLLLRIEERDLRNVRIICHDAVEVLADHMPPRCLDAAHIFFPDPWHKKRHHKRRLIQQPFVDLLAATMNSMGILRLATDWEEYAHQMLVTLNAHPAFETLADPEASSGFAARVDHRPLTRFERRGQRLGHGVWDLAYRRRNE